MKAPSINFVCPHCEMSHVRYLDKGNIIEENFAIECKCGKYTICANLNLEVVYGRLE